ncbi:MAG: DUF4115 domain-containing protein, partial [Sulfitobacter sp.]
SVNSAAPSAMEQPRAEALDRLYRPQALDVPVLVARDAPISTIDPLSLGNFARPETPKTPEITEVAEVQGPALPDFATPVPQVLEGARAAVRMVAAYPSWVQVKAADGTTIFTGTLDKGDVYEVPVTEEPATLLTGESGAIYFAMADTCIGPVGARGSVTKNLSLDQNTLAELYQPVDPTVDNPLNRMFADLANSDIDPAVLASLPCKSN